MFPDVYCACTAVNVLRDSDRRRRRRAVRPRLHHVSCTCLIQLGSPISVALLQASALLMCPSRLLCVHGRVACTLQRAMHLVVARCGRGSTTRSLLHAATLSWHRARKFCMCIFLSHRWKEIRKCSNGSVCVRSYDQCSMPLK